MRNVALAALAVAASVPVLTVTGSNEANAFWNRGRTYVAAPAYCCRPRVYGYWRPRARVWGPIYAKAPLGWYGPVYAPRTYGWWGRAWTIDRCGSPC